jgi:hypothetical protein
MSKFMRELWDRAKTYGEDVGLPLLIIGFVALLPSVLALAGVITDSGLVYTLLSLGLAAISVGLGFTSVGISTNADNRQTDLLKRLDRSVGELPLQFEGDILSPSAQMVVRELHEKQSREAAQKRLDEDTERFGHVRGELFQNEDGSWSINWGGKYPL